MLVSKVVQARLDDEMRAVLDRLRRRTGVGESELVRRGLKLLASASEERPKRIVGLGRFASGRADLGSNKRHLHAFGRS